MTLHPVLSSIETTGALYTSPAMQNRLPSCPKKMLYINIWCIKLYTTTSGSGEKALERAPECWRRMGLADGTGVRPLLCSTPRFNSAGPGDPSNFVAVLSCATHWVALLMLVGPLTGQSLDDLSNRDSSRICSGMTSI